MQLTRQQRRTRRDAESRDYVCQCGKSYLSYAAAYTHAKKNHPDNRDYINSIRKPAREMNQRGRPKRGRQNTISSENIVLSICQQTILKIFQISELSHNPKFKSIILQGDQTLNEQKVHKEINNICIQKSKIRYHYSECSLYQRKFVEGLIKHLIPSLAARVTIIVHLLTEFSKEEVMEQVKQTDLTYGQNAIVQVIHDGWDKFKNSYSQTGTEDQLVSICAD